MALRPVLMPSRGHLPRSQRSPEDHLKVISISPNTTSITKAVLDTEKFPQRMNSRLELVSSVCGIESTTAPLPICHMRADTLFVSLATALYGDP